MLRKDERLLLIVSAVFLIVVACFRYNHPYFDTASYFAAWDVIKTGSIDQFRTPVYPAFIGLIRDCTPTYEAAVAVIVVLQCMLFLWSVSLFYRLLSRLCDRRWICFVTSLLYTIVCGDYCFYILTEALSVVMAVWMIWLTYKIWTGTYGWRTLLLLAFDLSLMLMLRPAAIALVPVAFVLLVRVWCISGARQAVPISVVAVVPCLLLIGYSALYSHLYGIFSTSWVSVANQYSMLDDDGMIDAKALDRTLALQQGAIPTENDTVIDFFYLKARYGIVPVDHALKDIIKTNPKPYLLGIYQRGVEYSSSYLAAPYLGQIFMVVEDMLPRMRTLYWLLAFCGVYIAWYVWYYRRVPFVVCVYTMMVCVFATTVIGAGMEWPRLNLLSIVAGLLIIGQILCNFSVVIRPKRDTDFI